MQILESSIFGLRAVRLSLRAPGAGVIVTLFPMVHMGEPRFYEEVYKQAADNDVVLVEGVTSPVVKRITRSYRWLQGSKRLNLHLQPKFSLPTGSTARVVHADLTRDEFEAAWRKVPGWLAWALYLLAPFHALKLRLDGSREQLARRLAMDQEPSLDDYLNRGPETAAISDVILDLRDQRLIEVLDKELDGKTGGSIAVVYGAGHMRALLKEMISVRRFTVGEATWMTIFSV